MEEVRLLTRSILKEVGLLVDLRLEAEHGRETTDANINRLR